MQNERRGKRGKPGHRQGTWMNRRSAKGGRLLKCPSPLLRDRCPAPGLCCSGAGAQAARGQRGGRPVAPSWALRVSDKGQPPTTGPVPQTEPSAVMSSVKPRLPSLKVAHSRNDCHHRPHRAGAARFSLQVLPWLKTSFAKCYYSLEFEHAILLSANNRH